MESEFERWCNSKCACVHPESYECARRRDGADPDDWRYVKRRCECVCHDEGDRDDEWD